MSPACTGAWIETVRYQTLLLILSGRPLVRGRGLKLKKLSAVYTYPMSPACTGAWIETKISQIRQAK